MPNTAQTRTEAYDVAKAADEAFEAAVRAAGFKSRWDAGVDTHPDVTPARLAKYAADSAMFEAFRAADGEPNDAA